MRALLALVIVVALVFGGAGWMFSDQIRDEALDLSEFEFDPSVEVRGVSRDEITLAFRDVGETELDRAEVAGLVWDDGYGRIREFVTRGDGTVVRGFELVEGRLPAVGDEVAVDEYAFRGDPRSAQSLIYEEVNIAGPLGPMPAWVIRSDPNRPWVVLVHGRSDRGRAEFLRVLPALRFAGYNVLVPTYRNDDGAPQVEDRRVRFGATEWEDLAAAVDWVRAEGADSISLVGYSMGGSIVLSFLLRDPQAGQISAVFLDSPVTNIGRTLELLAGEEDLPIPGYPVKVPSALAKTALWISELRFDVDFAAMDYVAKARDLPSVPILLVHGTDDVTVPIETSRAFAEDASRARLVELSGVAHVRGWNVDPDGYEQRLLEFLGRYN